MPRYITKPKAYWEYGEWKDSELERQSLTVQATDAKRTGLLDKDGNELIRRPEPIGFLPSLRR